MAGVLLLAAWIPLLGLPTLRGAQVVLFLCSFGAAGLAYIWALRRLKFEIPGALAHLGFCRGLPPGITGDTCIAFR